jgi:general secretion pathway protein G
MKRRSCEKIGRQVEPPAPQNTKSSGCKVGQAVLPARWGFVPIFSQLRRNQRGLTLVELIVAFTIMSLLAAMAVPLARSKVRRERERELRYALREVRTAIDKYKDAADAQLLGTLKLGTEGYPEKLEVLVEGVKMAGQVDKKLKFLRRIPKDPMTNSYEWGLRSLQDEPASTSWGGQNVFDVYTKSTAKAADGTPYSEW